MPLEVVKRFVQGKLLPDIASIPVHAEVRESGCRLRVEACGVFDVDCQQGGFRYSIERHSFDPSILLAAIHGPVGALLLASQQSLLLHASAVLIGDKAVVFLGDEGAGKSTLARDPDRMGWRRIADDLLPVSLREGVAVARPWFFQPKLDAAEQYPANAPSEVPLVAIYLLAGDVEARVINIESLAPAEGALTVVAHSVAARLFPDRLVTWHLDFSARFAGALKIRRLHFPWNLNSLGALRTAIVEDVADAP